MRNVQKLGSSMLLVLAMAACGGESEVAPPPAAPPPPPPVAVAPPPPAPEPAPAPPEPPKPSLAELEKSAIDGAQAAMNAHDAKKFSEAYAPDAVSMVYGGAELKGREAIAADMQKIFEQYGDFKIAVTKLYAKGDVVVQEWTMTATHKGDYMGVKASGKPVGVRGATVLWFNTDGLVKQEHRYFDANTVLFQIGASKAPARGVEKAPSGEPEWHLAKGTPEEEKALGVVRGLYASFEKKSETDFVAALDEKGSWSDLASPKDMASKDGKRFFQTFVKAFPDAKTTLEPIFAADEYVVAEVTINATHAGPLGPLKATKKPVALHSLDISTVKDGKIVRGASYSNTMDLLGQEGLLPKPKAAKADAPAKDEKKPAAKEPEKKAADKPAAKEPEKKAADKPAAKEPEKK